MGVCLPLLRLADSAEGAECFVGSLVVVLVLPARVSVTVAIPVRLCILDVDSVVTLTHLSEELCPLFILSILPICEGN